MRFAICNETFQDWPFEQAFALARECGYEGIEFAPFTLGDNPIGLSANERGRVRQQVADAELEVVGLHWLLAKTEGLYLTSPDRDVRTRTSNYFIELARLCCDLGGRVLVLGSPQQRNLLPGVTHDEAADFAAEVIRGALSAFDEYDVTLALEPLGPAEGDFMLTADAAVQLARQIDSTRVRLHLDVKAMSSETTPIPEIIRRHAGMLEHFHANDPNKRGPGMGDCDFIPIFQALQDVGYRGWVSVEVFDYEPGVRRLAEESIRYMRNCLGAIGG